MGYSNLNRVIAAIMLLAFTSPSVLAISATENAVMVPATPYSSSMNLNGGVKLTDNNETVTLSLRDSDVKQVLRMFADKVGMNIILHRSVAGKVTLDLVNTPI